MSTNKTNKNNDVATEQTVKEAENVEVLTLSIDEERELLAISELTSLNYDTDLSFDEILANKNNANNDLIDIEHAIKRVNVLIDIYQSNDTLNSELHTLIDGLKRVKNDIVVFQETSKKQLETLEKVDAKDKINLLKGKGFYSWKTPLIKYNENLYELKGFSNNCKVYLRVGGAKVQLKIIIMPLDFESKKQSEHFAVLCDENYNTVKKAVEKFLGKVTKSYELDSIVRVQQLIEKEEQKAKLAKTGDKLLEKLN